MTRERPFYYGGDLLGDDWDFIIIDDPAGPRSGEALLAHQDAINERWAERLANLPDEDRARPDPVIFPEELIDGIVVPMPPRSDVDAYQRIAHQYARLTQPGEPLVVGRDRLAQSQPGPDSWAYDLTPDGCWADADNDARTCNRPAVGDLGLCTEHLETHVGP